MKEHLKKYFPERFEDTDPSLTNKVAQFFVGKDVFVQKNKCEFKVAKLFRESGEIKLLVGAMKRYGCNFSLARHISCEDCHPHCNGGYDPDTNQIVICHNRVALEAQVLSTLVHEMIHMFDYCRAKFDFNKLEHVACSEIRAANLTYCSFIDKLKLRKPGMFSVKDTHKFCVKDVAFESTKAYSPNSTEEEVWQAVDKAFDGCYNDLEPFGRRPRNGSQEFKQAYRERYYYGYVDD